MIEAITFSVETITLGVSPTSTVSTQPSAPKKDWCTSWDLNNGQLAVCQAAIPLHQRIMRLKSCELYKKKTLRVSRQNYLAYVRKATLDLDEFGHRENWPPVQPTSIIRRSFFRQALLKSCNLVL